MAAANGNREPGGLLVLFVCTGNTCRSPLAEVLAYQMFTGASFRFFSAGLQARPDSPASPGARAVARECGLSLCAHRSRRVDPSVLIRCSWAIGMTAGQATQLAAMAPEGFPGKIGLLGIPGVDLRCGGEGGGEEVTDPFGGTVAEYRAVALQIRRLLNGWSGVFGPPASDPC